MKDRTVVYITWEELFGEVPTENEVRQVVKTFNRQSTVVLLAQLSTHLFLDRFRSNSAETTDLQTFLVNNFWDDEVFGRAKNKMGSARLDFRRAFHSLQILTLLKWTIQDALPIGGVDASTDKEGRFMLGRCLLKTSDLLFTGRMKADINRDRKFPSAKKYLRLQLAMGANTELNNPPPVANSVARNAIIFEEIMKRVPSPTNIGGQFSQESGVLLDLYVDCMIGVLSNYLCRTPRDLIANPDLLVIDPKRLFGSSVPLEMIQKFWKMESNSMDELASSLSKPSELAPHQDLTAFRMKPFLRLSSGNVICVHPAFLQEKLEIGLFWTIVNNLQGEARQNAFEVWGKLFETYVNRLFESAVDPAKERYVACPQFTEKKHQHEAFDGILLSGSVCAVIECKGGFLPNNAKYGEDLTQFVSSLEKKFATEPRAGLEQLVRKIAQVFAPFKKDQRELEGIDLSAVRVVIPILIVQDNFVASLFSVPWLAKSFRSLMRKQVLNRRIVLTSLLVLHSEDVENLQTYVKSGRFSLGECLLHAGKCGDPGPGRLFAFADILRGFLQTRNIDRVPLDNDFDKKFHEVLNRVSLRFFNQRFEPGELDASGDTPAPRS
jgi:hypothetical protein